MTQRRGLVHIAGFRVRELREASGWTQLWLACNAGMDQGAISDIEGGRTRRVQFKTLHKLARLLRVESAALILRGDSTPARVPPLRP